MKNEDVKSVLPDGVVELDDLDMSDVSGGGMEMLTCPNCGHRWLTHNVHTEQIKSCPKCHLHYPEPEFPSSPIYSC